MNCTVSGGACLFQNICCNLLSLEQIFEIAMYKTEASVVSSAFVLLIVSDKGVLLSARKYNEYILCGKVKRTNSLQIVNHAVCLFQDVLCSLFVMSRSLRQPCIKLKSLQFHQRLHRVQPGSGESV